MASVGVRRDDITTLAPETSAEILWYASRKDKAYTHPPVGGITLDAHRLTNLRLVCKKWDQLIRTTPFLWSSFSPLEPIHRIKKILDYTGPSAPLTISEKDRPFMRDPASPDATKLVFSKLHRTSSLYISLEESKWQATCPAFEAIDHAPVLESLDMTISGRHKLGLRNLPSCPKLRNLRLSGIQLPSQFDPLPNLVSLHLIDPGEAGSVSNLLEALRCLPALQHLRLNNCFPNERREDDYDDKDPAPGMDKNTRTRIPGAPVALRCLRSLEIIDASIGECAFFLGSIRAILDRLHVTYVEPRTIQYERLQLMVHASLVFLGRLLVPPQKLLVIEDIFDTDCHGSPNSILVSSLRPNEEVQASTPASSSHNRDDDADDGDDAPLKISVKKRFDYYGDDDHYYDDDFAAADVASIYDPVISRMHSLLHGVSKLLIDHESSHFCLYWEWMEPVLRRYLPAVQCVELIPCGYISEEEEEDDEVEEGEEREPKTKRKPWELDDFDLEVDADEAERPGRTFGRLVRHLGPGWVVESPGVLKKVTKTQF